MNRPDVDDLKRGWDLSAGFFRTVSLPAGTSLVFRLESGINWFGNWEEVYPFPDDASYGLYLYPEISFAPSDSASIYLRSIISPIDQSALTFAGFSWNIYQGFTLNVSLAFMVGDADDHFSWGKSGDLSLTTRLEYVFGTGQ